MTNKSELQQAGLMRWLKYIAIGLTSLIIVSIASVVTLALLLEQDELRDALVKVVNRTTDHYLEIKGPMEIDFSLSPSIKVSDISFKTATDDFELHAAEIHLQVDIIPLLSEHLVMHEFLFRDGTIDIRQLPDESEEDAVSTEPLQINTPVIENVNIENLVISYWQQDETEPLHINLDSLKIDDKQDKGAIELTSVGNIDETPFHLEGDFGALALLIAGDQPYPFKIRFDVMGFLTHAEGTIANPNEAGDLDIAVRTEAADVQSLLQLLHVDVPDLGKLTATYKLAGSLNAPQMNDIDISVSNDKAALHVSGAIGNIITAEDLELDYSAAITDDKLLLWLLPDQVPLVNSLKSSGKLSGSADTLSLGDFKLDVSGPRGRKLEIAGSTRFVKAPQPLRDLNATLSISSPDTKFIRQFAETVPLMGPVSSVASISTDADALVIKGIKLTVGTEKKVRIGLQGDIGHITLAPAVDVSGIDIKIELSASDLNALGQQFDQSLPKEGPVKSSARVKGSLGKLHYNGRTSLRNTTITTNLTASFTGDRPRLAGAISIPNLDVHDIGIYPEKWAAETSAPATKDLDQAVVTERLFSKEPIDFSGLNTIDLDLEVTINKLSSTAASIADIYSHILLKNGKLDIKPLKYSVADDVINNDVMINSSTKPPKVSLLVTSDRIDLGLLLADSGSEKSLISGFMTAKVNMRSRGQSPAELAANLDGEINLVTENAKFDKEFHGLVKIDVIGWAITNMVSLKKDINIECAILMTHFNKGMGKTDLHIIKTPDTLIRIDTKLDLVNETMDVVIVPEHKKRLFKTEQDPMKITGPIANPQYKLVSPKDITWEAGRSYLLAPLTISGGLLDNITGLIVEPDEPKGSCDKYLK
jgi:uncharacterized protein involved in outer membrane biogenesis